MLTRGSPRPLVTSYVAKGIFENDILDPALMFVGSALAAVRLRANLTQVELAKRLKKPQSVISAIEAGHRRLDLVEFLLIVRTLGADPVEIFAGIACSDGAGGEQRRCR